MQILEHIICYINIITMQNTILIAEILIKSASKKEFFMAILDAKIMQVWSAINFLLKYNWHLNFMDNKAMVDLELRKIEKY